MTCTLYITEGNIIWNNFYAKQFDSGPYLLNQLLHLRQLADKTLCKKINCTLLLVAKESEKLPVSNI